MEGGEFEKANGTFCKFTHCHADANLPVLDDLQMIMSVYSGSNCCQHLSINQKKSVSWIQSRAGSYLLVEREGLPRWIVMRGTEVMSTLMGKERAAALLVG